MEHEMQEPKRRDPKLIKIGQLKKRALSPKRADELALQDEDTQTVMANKRRDYEISARKNKNRGGQDERDAA